MTDFFFEIFKSTNEVIIDSTRMTKFVECLPVFVTKIVSFMESYNQIDQLFFSINCFVYPFGAFAKVPRTCFPFQVHNFNGIGAAGLETERTKRYSFMVLLYLFICLLFCLP